MFQQFITFFSSSDGILLLLMGTVVLIAWFYVLPMAKENKQLKEIHHETLEHLPKLSDYETKFDSFKRDLVNIINRYENTLSDDVARELTTHLKEIEETIKRDNADVSSLIQKYLNELGGMTKLSLEMMADTKERTEKSEHHIKSNKYQFARVRVVLDNVIMVNQQLSKFFISMIKDIEEKGVLTKVNYEPLLEINRILVSINSEATRIVTKVIAEENDLERMLSDY